MRKHGNGLRSIGVLCCLLLLLPLGTLSAESNLYQDLMDWSDSFELKLTGLEKRFDRLEVITIGLPDSMKQISLDFSELKKNSDERWTILQKQESRLQEVERIQTDSSTTLAYLETFSSETEKALRQLRLKNDILIGTAILLALSVAIVAIL